MLNDTPRVAGPFAGDDVTTALPFEFKVFADLDLAVLVTDATGEQTLVVLDVDYTVTLNADQEVDPGGTVTLADPLATGYTALIVSALIYDQPLDLHNAGKFHAQSIEDAFDRVVMQLRQVSDVADRSLHFPPGDASNSEFPSAAVRAGTLAAFDGLGHATVFDLADLGNIVASRSDVIISVTDYGAVGDGVTNDTTAINNAEAAAAAEGSWLVFPNGDYLYSGTVYPVIGQARVLNRDFDDVGYTPAAQAASQALTILLETPDTTPIDSADSRLGISITAQANGSQHASGIRVNLRNRSDDGNGCTGVYVNAQSDTDALWSAALHAETRHGATSGGTHALNLEIATYAATGNAYGIVVHNATATTGATHALTGGSTISNPNVYAIHILGNNNTDPKGGWVRGINFSEHSMRAAGDCIYIGVSAAVDTVLKTTVDVESAVADIYLQGNSLHGIILAGNYTNAAIRLADDQYVSLRTNNQIKMRYDTGSTEFEVVAGASERFSVYMGASPYISLNDTQVVGIRDTGWAAMTGTTNKATVYDTATVTLAQLAGRMMAVQAALTDHGLIGA